MAGPKIDPHQGTGAVNESPVRQLATARRGVGTKGTSPPTDGPPGADQRLAYMQEAHYIEKAAEIWSSVYRRETVRWRRYSMYLSLISAVAAAAAAGTGLTGDRPVAAASIALAASVMAAVSSTLGGAKRTEDEQKAAVANTVLADSARVFRTTSAPYEPMENVEKLFVKLCQQRDRVVADSPIEVPRALRKVSLERNETWGDMPARPGLHPYRVEPLVDVSPSFRG